METLVYRGRLVEKYWAEDDSILHLEGAEEPFALKLDEDFGGRLVTVRYYICGSECTLEEAQESFLKQLSGVVETDIGAHYSEITGHLWTDEGVKIGGHDLIAELHSFIGKWLILLVDIH